MRANLVWSIYHQLFTTPLLIWNEPFSFSSLPLVLGLCERESRVLKKQPVWSRQLLALVLPHGIIEHVWLLLFLYRNSRKFLM